MNNERTEDNLLKQVDDLLDHGTASDHALVNELASTMPDADPDFQEQLEERLVAMLANKVTQQKTQDEAYVTMKSITPMTRRQSRPFPYARWAAMLVMILAGTYLFKLYQQGNPEMAIPLPVDAREHTVVVAVKYITPGDLITEEMLDLITLDAEVFAKLQHSYPGETFYSDVSLVTGRRAIVWVNPLEPFLRDSLEPGKDNCLPSAYYGCVYDDIDINVPIPDIEMEKFGVSVGDRVDVFVDVNNQYPVIKDVRLSNIRDSYITLKGSAWKYALLNWHLRIEDKSYFLRPHKDDEPIEAPGQQFLNYTLRTLTPLDELGPFYLSVQLPLRKAYLLTQPASLDSAKSWIKEDQVEFSFSDVELVRSVDESTFVLRMPEADVSNLDYLLDIGGALQISQESLGASTPIPTEVSDLLAEPPATPLPEGYSEIILPMPQGIVQDLKPGDRVDVLTVEGTNDTPLVRNVLLVNQQNDQITVAAPSWKHTLLVWSLGQNKAYTLQRSESISDEWDATLVEYTLEAPEPLPDDYQFDLVVRVPYSQGPQLADMPDSLDQIKFTANGNTMSFWFTKLRMLSITNGTTVIVEMPMSEAESLDALIEAGAALGFQPDANPPTATPTSIAGAIPSGRVAISLPVKELPPRPDQMDVILTLPETNIAMSEEDRKAIQDTEHFRINNGMWEFRFTDMVILEIHGGGGPESSDGEVTVTVHVTPEDATIIQDLLQIGAEVQFAPKIDDALAESGNITNPSGTPYPTFTMTPDNSSSYMAAIPTALPNRPCPPEAQYCVTVPANYSQIRLPIPRIPATGMWFDVGDRVNLWLSPNDQNRLILENILFVGTEIDTLIFAAPAWKYAVLYGFLGSGESTEYTMRPYDGTDFPILATSEIPTMYTLNNLHVPLEIFDLRVKVPPSEIQQLAAMPHLISSIDSAISEGALYFWFRGIEKRSTNSDSSYVIALSSDQAAALDYLRTIGGELDVSLPVSEKANPPATFTPTFTPMPTFTPVATLTPEFLPEGATLIPQDRVAMPLPATDPMPDAPFDVIMSLPHNETDTLFGLTYSFNHLAFQINLQTWDMRFTDVELIEIYEPGTIDPAIDERIVSVHVRRADATILQYLLDHGAAIRFVPSD